MLKPTTTIVNFLCLLVLLTLSSLGPLFNAKGIPLECNNTPEDREVTSSSVMEEKFLKMSFSLQLPYAENSSLDFPSYQILLEQYLPDDLQRPPSHILS